MSSDYVLLSQLAKIKINGNLYGVTRGELRVSSTRLEKTDSGDFVTVGGKIFHFRNFTNTLYMAEATLTAQRSGDTPPHASRRLHIGTGNYINLQISPDGTFIESRTYQMDQFLVENYRVGLQVRGSEPQTFEFSGVATPFSRVLLGFITDFGPISEPFEI